MQRYIWPVDVTPGEGTPWNAGEPYDEWTRAIQAMRDMIDLWTALDEGNVQWLVAHMTIDLCSRSERASDEKIPCPPADSFQVCYDFNGASTTEHVVLPFPPSTDEDFIRMVSASSIIRAGLQLFEQLLNSHLAYETATCMRYVESDARPRLHVISRNLLGALWFQFARGIDGKKDYRKCRECETWLEVSLKDTGHSTSQIYCSPACRSKAYRNRRLAAHQLHAEGLAPDVIAARLGTDVSRVCKWLKSPPPIKGLGRRGRPRKQLTTS